jgi:hypothetical protein
VFDRIFWATTGKKNDDNRPDDNRKSFVKKNINQHLYCSYTGA